MPDKSWQTWVWIKWKPGTPSDAWEKWKGHPQVKGAWSTLGAWDCMLWLDIADPDKLEEFVWKQLRTNSWVEGTHTSFAKKWW